ncbi:MAG TPA: DMT family transporter [Phycisphaerae bacterium]|nr:DMT family transporter [Phycisphaerae bacterium]HOI55642.1 DMT family transporter [Phycisphaerae bacterium]
MSFQRHRAFGIAALVLSMVGWGVTFCLNRFLLRHTPVAAEPWSGLSLTVLRFALLVPLIVPWTAVILWRRRRHLRRDLFGLCGLGLFGVVGYYLLANTAQVYASASMNAVLHQMTPLVAFVGGLVVLRERLTAAKLIGTVLALAAAVAYSLIEAGADFQGDNIPLAVLLIFLTALDWTVYMLIAKRLLARWSPIDVSVAGNGLGIVLLMLLAAALRPLGLAVRWSILAELGAVHWAVILYLAFGAGLLCYILYNAGLRTVEASRAAVFTYLLVPAAMVSALWLPGDLKEPLSLWKCLCAAGIIAGVAMVTWRSVDAQTPGPAPESNRQG